MPVNVYCIPPILDWCTPTLLYLPHNADTDSDILGLESVTARPSKVLSTGTLCGMWLLMCVWVGSGGACNTMAASAVPFLATVMHRLQPFQKCFRDHLASGSNERMSHP